MKTFSFIFAGTSEVALNCLKLLLQSQSLSLKGIVTRAEALKGRGLKKQSSVLKAFAEQHKIPCWTPQKTSEPEFLNEIREKKCDFSFVCSYGQILPKAYLQAFPKGCVNLHFSLLPKWRGAAPVQRALMAGDKHTGVGLQIMSEGLDEGDLIGSRKFEIRQEDNAENIFNRSLVETRSLIEKELIQYLEGQIKGQAQDHSQKSYAHKIDKKETQIVWTEEAVKIHNKIRALYLGPQAFFTFQGKRIKVYQSQVIQKKFPDFAPGEVCSIEKDKLVIACGEGALSLLEVQKEGKKRQRIEDFLKGFPLKLKNSFC